MRAAVAWARSALPGYGVAPGPVVLWGDSAGGHLALLAALTGTGLDNTGVDGVVAWFPVTDLADLGDGDDPQSREALFLGAPPAQVPDLAREASPITHVQPARAAGAGDARRQRRDGAGRPEHPVRARP